MRKRLRSTCKWGGTAATVLLLVVWVGSGWWRAIVFVEPNGWVEITTGRLELCWPRQLSVLSWNDTWTDLDRHGFEINWAFEFESGITASSIEYRFIGVPLWLFVFMAGFPPECLWYRDRRRQPGLCLKCGYDLRGNTSGVCPDCGSS